MKKTFENMRVIIWRGLIVCVLVFSIATIILALKSKSDTYDYDEAIAKLKTIGRALQIYRAEYGYLPPNERKNYSDAGLPPSLHVLLKKGYKWSLSDSNKVFQLTQPALWRVGDDSHFLDLYWPEWGYKQLGDISFFFKGRGENLPILADDNMNSIEDYLTPGNHAKALILRLNGEVELVTFDPTKRLELQKK